MKRGTYTKLADEDRSRIGRYACENGVARHFTTALHLKWSLNKSTVCGIKIVYLAKLT